jgi:hypothetical protein
MNEELGNITMQDLAKPFDVPRFTYSNAFICKNCLHHDSCHYELNGIKHCTACKGVCA